MEWVKAFTAFMAAVAQRQPARLAGLLAYQLTTIKAAQSYDCLQWQGYDTHFRVAAAATENKDWAKLDVDVYTRFFKGRAKTVQCCTICDSMLHTASGCPSAVQPRRPSGGKTPANSFGKRRRSWNPCSNYSTLQIAHSGKMQIPPPMPASAADRTL